MLDGAAWLGTVACSANLKLALKQLSSGSFCSRVTGTSSHWSTATNTSLRDLIKICVSVHNKNSYNTQKQFYIKREHNNSHDICMYLSRFVLSFIKNL